MKNKAMQLGAMLAAVLLVSMVFVPMVSAKKDTNDGEIGNVTIQNVVASAKITADPYEGSVGSKFTFKGDASTNQK